MTDQAIFQKWPDRVAYDMDTAKARVETGRLIYAIFMCQQSLEKCFKALLAYQEKEVIPIHNLRRLAERKGKIPSPHRSPTFVFLSRIEVQESRSYRLFEAIYRRLVFNPEIGNNLKEHHRYFLAARKRKESNVIYARETAVCPR